MKLFESSDLLFLISNHKLLDKEGTKKVYCINQKTFDTVESFVKAMRDQIKENMKADAEFRDKLIDILSKMIPGATRSDISNSLIALKI